MDDLNNALVKCYGTMIEDDIDIIRRKIAALITAHEFAGNIGTNPLCVLNRAFEEIIK